MAVSESTVGFSHELFSQLVIPLIYPTSRELWHINKQETEQLRESFAGATRVKRVSATNSNKNHNLTYGEVTPRSIEEHVLGFHGALSDDDVFYDLGSGDGKIMLQVLLATPAKAGKGIEFAAGREGNAQKAKQRMQTVTARQAEAALHALPLEMRVTCVKQLLQLPALPSKAAPTLTDPPKGQQAVAAAAAAAAADSQPLDGEESEEDPSAMSAQADSSAEPTAASTPAGKAAAAAGAGADTKGIAQRRTPGSNAKRQLFSPSTSAQEESKADASAPPAGRVSQEATAKLAKAEGVAAQVLVQHLRHAASRFTSIQGDFIVEDFSDATHIFVNNTVFEADLMQRLREKLAAAPALKALTTLRKICHRHSKRCEFKRESCGAFQHPPEEGICWPTWCGETSLFKYTPRDK